MYGNYIVDVPEDAIVKHKLCGVKRRGHLG